MSIAVNYEEFQNICRTCLFIGKLRPVNDDAVVVDVLKLVCGTDVKNEADLPQKICETCYKQIHQINEFALKCKQNETTLKKCKSEYFERQVQVESIEIKDEMVEIKQELETTVPFENVLIKSEPDANLMINETIEEVEDVDESEEEETTTQSQLSVKSEMKYEQAYDRYIKWCDTNVRDGESITSEKTFLEYFTIMSRMYKSTTMWAFYSMLRTTMSKKHNIDMSKYYDLSAFLKRRADGYEPRKSKVFTKIDVERFLKQADDLHYLVMKVALIVGLAGACRREELTHLLLENVTDLVDLFQLRIPSRNKNREFYVTPGNIPGVNMVHIVRGYLQLRPRNLEHGRFFCGYKKGRCLKLPVGINTISKMPSHIAAFLKLPHADEYTGHCFKRSSKFLLNNIF